MAFAPPGMKILNTRPREQAGELSRMLRDAGYHPVEVALVELVLLPGGLKELDALVGDPCDGFLLSSPNLLPLLAARAGASLLRALAARPWYLISSRSRSQVEALGAKVAFVPRHASIQGFLKELPPQKSLRLLHLCSRATHLEPSAFSGRNIAIRNLCVYAPHCPADAEPTLRAAWPQARAVLFASGSAVGNLFATASDLGRTLGTAKGPRPVSIGPSATEALRAHGVGDLIQAPTADNAGLITALNAVIRK